MKFRSSHILLLLLCFLAWPAYCQVNESAAPSRDEDADVSSRQEKKDIASPDLPAELYGTAVVSNRAWINYYHTKGYRNPNIKALLEAYMKNTYAYHYILGDQAKSHASAIKHLKKAIQVNAAGLEAYQVLSDRYLLAGKTADRKQLFRKWKSSDAAYGTATNTLAYNQLASMSGKSILITSAATHRYPVEVQKSQQNLGNIAILSKADISGNTELGKKQLQSIGASITLGGSLQQFMQRAQSLGINVYLSIDNNPTQLGSLASNLYLTGVAYQYSPSPINNYDILIQNWESRFIKPNIGNGRPALRELIYFYPLVSLIRAYENKGKGKAADKLRVQARYLANSLNRKDLLAFIP